MDENQKTKLIKRAIDEQDMLAYFSYANIEELLMGENIDSDFKFPYSRFTEFLDENPEVLDSWSMNNLVLALDSKIKGNKIAAEKAASLVMEKFHNGEHIFSEGNASNQFIGPAIDAWSSTFSVLGVENVKEIKQSIEDELKNLEIKDPRAYKFANSLRQYYAIDSFLCSYEKGEITTEKMDFLEKLQSKNPNIVDKMSYAILKDEIFEMGENIVERIAKYPNISTKLIKLSNINKDAFEIVKKGFIDAEKNTRKPEVLALEQSALTYAFRHFKEVDGLSFEELANLGLPEIEKFSIKTEDGIELFDPNEGSNSRLEALRKSFDVKEKYAKVLANSLNDTFSKMNSSEAVKYIDVNGNKVKQIELSDNFNILVHSTDSGFKGDKKILDGDFRKTWEQNEDVAVHLTSSCYMTQDFMGYVPTGKNGVLTVFSNVKSDDVILMGTKDINSHIRSYDTRAQETLYINADEMPQYSRRVYAEVPVEIQSPDAILVFDDTPEDVLKNSYKAAEDFGTSVIFIDKQKVEKKQLEKLDNMLEDFNSTGNLDTLGNLVSMYETNVAGWLLNRENQVDDNTITGPMINNERFAKDFDIRGQAIKNSIDNYISENLGKPEFSRDSYIISKIMQTELDKYEYANNDNNKVISKTAPKIDYQAVLDRIKEFSKEEKSIIEDIRIQKPIDLAFIAQDAVEKGAITLEDIQNLRPDNVKDNNTKDNGERGDRE